LAWRCAHDAAGSGNLADFCAERARVTKLKLFFHSLQR